MRLLLLAVALCGGCGGGAISAGTAAAACAAANACQLGFGSVSSCTSGVANVSDPALLHGNNGAVAKSTVECVANAGSNCGNVRKCFNDGNPPQPCSAGSQSCNGTKLIGCMDQGNGTFGQTSYDCATTNEMCIAPSGSNFGCGIGTCSRDMTMCMADVLQTCSGGILSNFDCGHVAATCVTTGFAHCRGKGPGCTSQNPLNPFGDGLRCEGNTIVSCLDGQEARYDCTLIGQSCFANPRQQGSFGCALGAECDPANYTETCVGGTLTFCNNGKVDTFNCTSHGYSSCNASNGHACVI